MSSSSSNPSDGELPIRRYVFLVTPGEQPSPALLELLHRQGERPEEWIQADHPLIALAKIACLERDRRLQSRWYPDERFQNIFVVLNRDSWRDLESLFLTIQEHMRGVGILVCDDGLAIEIHPGERNPAADGADDGETSNEATPAAGTVETPFIFDDPTEVSLEGEESRGPSEPDDQKGNENFSDDEDDLRVTEAELRDLLDLYDSNIPDPPSESDGPDQDSDPGEEH